MTVDSIRNLSEVFDLHPGDRPCIVTANRIWTYSEVGEVVRRTAGELTLRHLIPGAVAACRFTDPMRAVIVPLALARLGVTAVNIPWEAPHRRRETLMRSAGVEVILTDARDPTDATPSTDRTEHVFDVDFEALMRGTGGTDGLQRVPSAPWTIVVGSGSTGAPKLIPVTHLQQLNRMRAGTRWLPYSARDVVASLVGLDFYGCHQRHLEAFMIGAAIRLPGGSFVTLANLVGRGAISVLYCSALHLARLAALPPTLALRFSRLTALMVGGSTVSMKLRRHVVEHVCRNLHVLYGSNESHTACMTRTSEVLDIPGNVGRAHPGFEVEVVDGAASPLGPGKAGLIRIRSDCAVEGYLEDDDATRVRFRGGWFYPGDVGFISEDGQLVHLGRADDLMIMNGINIYPAEIESAMASHPGVREALAFPIRHETYQDIPVCAVVLENGRDLDETVLLRFALGCLGSQAPKRVFIVPEIPRNDHGKIDRSALLERIRVTYADTRRPPDIDLGLRKR